MSTRPIVPIALIAVTVVIYLSSSIVFIGDSTGSLVELIPVVSSKNSSKESNKNEGKYVNKGK